MNAGARQPAPLPGQAAAFAARLQREASGLRAQLARGLCLVTQRPARDEDLERLLSILRQSAETLAAGGTLAELDAEFHKAIVAATHNDLLLRFINVFYRASRKRREVYFEAKGQSRRSHAQHLQLYRAIEARDVEAGQELLRRHLKGVDTYFRMFFADGARASKAAVHGRPGAPRPRATALAARR